MTNGEPTAYSSADPPEKNGLQLNLDVDTSVPAAEQQEASETEMPKYQGIINDLFTDDARKPLTTTHREFLSLLQQDIIDDIDAFPPDIQAKALDPNWFNPEESSETLKVIKKWWKDKYNFNFSEVRLRRDLLLHKYRSENIADINRNLYAAFLKSVGDKSGNKLKLRLHELYPDDAQLIEFIFGFGRYLSSQKKLDEKRDNPQVEKEKEPDPPYLKKIKRLQIVRDFTEFQINATHFILQHRDNEAYMEKIWQIFTTIAIKLEALPIYESLRNGVLAQVAAFHALQDSGLQPRLSTPEEDGRYAIDMWLSENTALQVKSWWPKRPRVIDVQLQPDMIKMGPDKVSQRIANRDLPQFSRKLQSYAKIHQIDVPKGLMLLIPKSMLNPNTGKPTPELVNFFKQKIVL